MPVIFINRYFHPDLSATSQMLSDLAFELARRGERISVITSRLSYQGEAADWPSRETVGNVDIHRVWTTRFGRGHLAGRAIDYATFYLSAMAAIWRLARAGDIVVLKTDPPMLGSLGGPVARWRKAHVVNWLQDLFPEVAEELMGRSKQVRPLFAVLRRLRDRSLRKADSNIVLGERMHARVRAVGVDGTRLAIIPNWADGARVRPVGRDVNALRAEWGLTGAFVVGYSGNLGRAHDGETMLDAMAVIEREAPRSAAAASVRWLFIGGGYEMQQLREAAAKRGLTSLQFRPYQPRERLAESLSAADVHLVTLRPELEGLIVPSKYYGVAAAARPVIFIGDANGEIAGIVQRHGAGTTVPEGDGDALAAAIRDLAADSNAAAKAGERARAGFEREFDFPLAVAAWQDLLANLRAPGPRR